MDLGDWKNERDEVRLKDCMILRNTNGKARAVEMEWNEELD